MNKRKRNAHRQRAAKVAPLMMSLLLMACGGEGGGMPSQPSGPYSHCSAYAYTCDSDGDGISNGEETDHGGNPHDPNDPVPFGDKDHDGDGTPNGIDPDYNSDADSDGDDLTNREEYEHGSNPNDPDDPLPGGGEDIDGDGTPNGADEDYHPQDDTDGDGLGNGHEYANGSDPLDPMTHCLVAEKT